MSDDVDEMLDRLEDRLSEDLEPIAPDRARSLWFGQLDGPAEETVQSYEYRIGHFMDFLEERGVDDRIDLTPRDVKEFEAERRAADNVESTSTLNTQLGTIRQFLAYCHELQAVSADVVEAMNVPSLTKDEKVNTEKLATQRAVEIFESLDKYRFASVEHVMMLLLWRTCARIGAIRSLDLRDLYLDEEDLDRLEDELRNEGVHPDAVEGILEEVELPVIWFRHRPALDSDEDGTPLKNREDGERVVNIREETAEVLRHYIKANRPDVRDVLGREPLLATRSGTGRRSRSNIRSWTYILTQPCEFGAPCPHDRDPEECIAREHGHGSKCPSSRSPHKLRTGSITDHRDRGWSVADLAEKANAGERLIRGVYDQPNALLRASRRRNALGRGRGKEDSS